MYKIINLKTLIIVFFILLAIVVLVKFIDTKKGDRTFNSELIDVDTSKITCIKFYPKAEKFKEICLEKNNKFWKLIFENKSYNADMSMVKSLLSELANLKPDHIASTDKSKWKEFEVNENEGVKVKVIQKNKTVAEFIVGKFAYQQPATPNPYQQQGSISTYIRLMNDDKVYAVNGYMNILFNRNAFSYKNKTVISADIAELNKLTFTYPSDSSFILVKTNKKWTINSATTDSNATINYLNTISHLSSEDFIDNLNTKTLGKPFCSLKLEPSNSNPIIVNVYAGDASNKYYISTSLNENQYFSGIKNNLFNKIFISKKRFIK